MSKKQTILVISDLHEPFSHPDSLAFLKHIKATYNPTDVVCIGDEVDYHALSFHDSDPDLDSVGTELIKARKKLQPVFKLFDKVSVIESNHGSMVMRKAIANGMSREFFRSYNEILGAPKGWRWSFDLTLKTPLGPVYFCHGKSGAAGRLASQYGMSCVQGHYHEKAQITYISTPERLLFDLHTGCLVNDRSLALGYNKVNPRRPIISLAVIVDGIPQLIPMVLNKKGRWVNK